MNTPTEMELEKRCEVTREKMGVAEDLGWPIAILAGLVVQIKWDSWLLGIVAGVVIYILVTHWYKKEYASASDVYQRATQTGKYYKPNEQNDVS